VIDSSEDEVRWLDAGEMAAWRSYVVSSALLEHRLNRDLQEAHDLSMADYEILVRLSEQAGHRMRMTELAKEVAHSKSRISHQVRRLERAGLVRREECPEDGRGIFAALTPAGHRRLRTAAPTHVASVRANLIDLLDPAEHELLAKVFDRVGARLRDES